MKPRTLIGMLIAGEELREMMDDSNSALRELARLRNQDSLQCARNHRDMLSTFIIALDNPEGHDELRDVLHEALQDMSDQVARFEEHVG